MIAFVFPGQGAQKVAMGKALVDGTPKGDAATAIDTLVRQESAPVPWEAVVGCLASEGVTTYVEVGPGSTLSGMVKKIHAGARIVRFGSPLDLDSVMAACSN